MTSCGCCWSPSTCRCSRPLPQSRRTTNWGAIRLAHQACRAFGIPRPRVAVAGLNPHAGENGLFGDEDRSVIIPAIAAAWAEGIDANGPWPGGHGFMRARRGEFDVVVAQYHDQGLIPVKYLGVEQGVNFSRGPALRAPLSVDHGTAFDIAGTGRADHASLACALGPGGGQGAGGPPGAGQAQRPDFIFMLTQQDKTIADARERLREVLAQGVRHVGFRHRPALPQLRELARSGRAVPGSIWKSSALTGPARWLRPARRWSSVWTFSWAARARGGAARAARQRHCLLSVSRQDQRASGARFQAGPRTSWPARAASRLEGVHGLDLLAYRVFPGGRAGPDQGGLRCGGQARGRGRLH
ncbi:PHD finger protein 20-like protein 1 [Manis javanica]|nr:PHD finger protein 20-like protein 1 [Manis javanica]